MPQLFNALFSSLKVAVLLSSVILLMIGLFNPAKATTNAVADCKTQIQQISVAKAKDEQHRPTQGWTTLKKLPDQWGKRWPDFHGIAWYKIQFNYQCSNAQEQSIALAIEGITQSGKVFLNNELLWQDLSVTEPSSRSQNLPRLWNLPASSLRQGENIVWVQVYGSITQKSGLGRVTIDHYPETYKIFKTWLLEKRVLLELNAMVNIVVGMFYFLAWLANRKEKAFFWIALTSLAWVIYSYCFLYTDPIPYVSTVSIDRVQNIIFCIYTVTGCLGAWYFANISFPRIQKMLFAFLAVATICISFAPINHVNAVMQFFFSIAVLIFVAKCATYPFIAYKSKLPEVYSLAALYLLYLPIAFHDARFMITMEGHPLSPYAGPFTTMAVGAVLAFRLARHKKQIESFNKTLSENITHAKQELTTSLGQQHTLALENALLQERIHLSHDLHDGLGGSIVRSIILLEQNAQIDKAQIMSILKLLRNDLRQVIDTGSSIGTKIPETPIEWGAPIRHRFVQLFEELEVKSKWSFDQAWNIPPNAVQCLTMTRIAEEALTNILKHSQASEVFVSLTESDEQQLILHIQDNGVGFEPATVQTGLHVGLQSMQARISRLCGKFTICSESGNTSIQVILPLHKNEVPPASNE